MFVKIVDVSIGKRDLGFMCNAVVEVRFEEVVRAAQDIGVRGVRGEVVDESDLWVPVDQG